MTQVSGRTSGQHSGIVGEKRGFRRVARASLRPADRTEERPARVEADILWDVAGIAAYLQVPVSAVYKMTARRAAVRIPHIRLGGKLRFRRSDVEQWLTLLTVSNLNTLVKVRSRVAKVVYGSDSQTTTGQR